MRIFVLVTAVLFLISSATAQLIIEPTLVRETGITPFFLSWNKPENVTNITILSPNALPRNVISNVGTPTTGPDENGTGFAITISRLPPEAIEFQLNFSIRIDEETTLIPISLASEETLEQKNIKVLLPKSIDDPSKGVWTRLSSTIRSSVTLSGTLDPGTTEWNLRLKESDTLYRIIGKGSGTSFSVNWDTTRQKDGTYQLTLESLGSDDRITTSSAITTIDNTPPTLFLPKTVYRATNSTQLPISWIATDETSRLESITINTASGSKTLSPDVSSFTISLSPSEENEIIEIIAKDVAGNEKQREVVIDHAPPEIKKIEVLTPETRKKVILELTYVEYTPRSLNLEIQRNGNTVSTTSITPPPSVIGALSHTNISTLLNAPEGQYDLLISMEDENGGRAESFLKNALIIDATAPKLEIGKPQLIGTQQEVEVLAIEQWSIAKASIQIDRMLFQDWYERNNLVVFSVDTSKLTDGLKSFKTEITDDAGNTVFGTGEVIVDNNPPVIDDWKVEPRKTGIDPYIYVRAHDPGAGIKLVQLTLSNKNTKLESTEAWPPGEEAHAFYQNIDALPDGFYELDISVRDAAGYQTPITTTIEINRDSQPELKASARENLSVEQDGEVVGTFILKNTGTGPATAISSVIVNENELTAEVIGRTHPVIYPDGITTLFVKLTAKPEAKIGTRTITLSFLSGTATTTADVQLTITPGAPLRNSVETDLLALQNNFTYIQTEILKKKSILDKKTQEQTDRLLDQIGKKLEEARTSLFSGDYLQSANTRKELLDDWNKLTITLYAIKEKENARQWWQRLFFGVVAILLIAGTITFSVLFPGREGYSFEEGWKRSIKPEEIRKNIDKKIKRIRKAINDKVPRPDKKEIEEKKEPEKPTPFENAEWRKNPQARTPWS